MSASGFTAAAVCAACALAAVPSRTRPAMPCRIRMGLDAPCAIAGLPCDGLSLEASQPIRMETGDLTATLADVPKDYFDPLNFTSRTLDPAPSGRQIDLRLALTRALRGGVFELNAVTSVQEGHRRDAEPNVGAFAGWRKRF